MKKIAILVEDHYQVLEVWYPYFRMQEAGLGPVFIGSGRSRQYKSKEGYPVRQELSIKKAREKDFEAVIIPGGYAPDMMRRSKEMIAFIKDMNKKRKIIAAICHGGWMLASAGILKAKKATSFYAIKDDLVNAGAKYVDREVVVDGNLITSRTPYDLPAFCREILRKLY